MPSFTKDERLCSSKIIRLVSSEGASFFNYPFKVIWITGDFGFKYPAQVLFNVSRRNFKSAVSRNRLKRMMREAYRLNKAPFYGKLAEQHVQAAIFLLYTGREILDYREIEHKIKVILQRLIQHHESASC